jgi:hypothetical protein
MSHNPVIPPTATCKHEFQVEYWHENDECDLEDCAVAECAECGKFATECVDNPWERNEQADISFWHCGQPAYWEGDDVYCSKCQEKMESD